MKKDWEKSLEKDTFYNRIDEIKQNNLGVTLSKRKTYMIKPLIHWRSKTLKKILEEGKDLTAAFLVAWP